MTIFRNTLLDSDQHRLVELVAEQPGKCPRDYAQLFNPSADAAFIMEVSALFGRLYKKGKLRREPGPRRGWSVYYVAEVAHGQDDAR